MEYVYAEVWATVYNETKSTTKANLAAWNAVESYNRAVRFTS